MSFFYYGEYIHRITPKFEPHICSKNFYDDVSFHQKITNTLKALHVSVAFLFSNLVAKLQCFSWRICIRQHFFTNSFRMFVFSQAFTRHSFFIQHFQSVATEVSWVIIKCTVKTKTDFQFYEKLRNTFCKINTLHLCNTLFLFKLLFNPFPSYSNSDFFVLMFQTQKPSYLLRFDAYWYSENENIFCSSLWNCE